ncbi:hypothetical protein NMG60_11013902 [Bertholletia excelsa]
MTGMVLVTKGGGCGGGRSTKGDEEAQQNNLSLVEVLVAALRKSVVSSCRVDRQDEVLSAVHHMEIGWPTNVQHIAHVTFDRFNGFLGLPVELEVEVPCRVPSASANVFGVSAESMQCSYDSRGNSVPTILLLMQERLYSQGGLKAEGIFRINPENSQEEQVRSQLNRGIVPGDIDVHCLAGLIKAWFRELPAGVLDGLSPEQVLQCTTEEESVELVKQLRPTEAALLSWAVDLMADVVEHEEFNKMNARNIAMVFAPNMTQMSDPLTALMHAVQVMNLLKTLITRTLRDRDEASESDSSPPTPCSSSDHLTDDGDQEDMDTSCELRGPVSDAGEEDDTDYSTTTAEENDENDAVESLTKIEERFLRQLDEKDEEERRTRDESTSPSQRESGQLVGSESERIWSDSKIGSSLMSTSDGEDSPADLCRQRIPLEDGDVEMTEKLVENFPPLGLVGIR